MGQQREGCQRDVGLNLQCGQSTSSAENLAIGVPIHQALTGPAVQGQKPFCGNTRVPQHA